MLKQFSQQLFTKTLGILGITTPVPSITLAVEPASQDAYLFNWEITDYDYFIGREKIPFVLVKESFYWRPEDGMEVLYAKMCQLRREAYKFLFSEEEVKAAREAYLQDRVLPPYRTVHLYLRSVFYKGKVVKVGSLPGSSFPINDWSGIGVYIKREVGLQIHF